MLRKFPHLSTPITIGRTTFRNRIFSAPMGGTDITNDGCIGPKSTDGPSGHRRFPRLSSG